MRNQPLPLLLLTGFLGSGKTSTLQHWLANTTVPLKRVGVIINDFGEVNVDAALLQRRQLELRSITGGCVCCQSFDDLVEQVGRLADNPDIDLAWIETSGLADPEEVLDHLSAAALQDRTVLRRMILVLDGADFPCSWRGREVQEEQIRYADVILLNKIDRLKDADRQRVEIALRKLNPEADIAPTQKGVIEPDRLSAASAKPAQSQQRATEHAGHVHTEDCGHDHGHDEHGHGHDHHGHDHGDHDHDHDHDHLPHSASTFFLPLNEPVERGAFQRFLGTLPTSVFRAKGFVRFTDSPSQVHTFQQVRDQAELLVLPLDDAPPVSTGLVFIGPGLDESRIRELAAGLETGQVVSS
jgi:G3E family GTPase